MSENKHTYRVIEYHGSLRGRVLWLDELRIVREEGVHERIYSNVTKLPVMERITVNVAVGV